MTTRELYCPNLQVQKMGTLVAPPRPVKPSHPPIADIIRVSTTLHQRERKGNAIRHLYREKLEHCTSHPLLGKGAPDLMPYKAYAFLLIMWAVQERR